MSAFTKAMSRVGIPAIGAIGGGVLTGIIGFFLMKILPMLLVVPVILGVLVGLILKMLFAYAKPSSVIFVVITVLMMSVVCNGSKQFAEYLGFTRSLSEHILPESTPDFLATIVNIVATPFVDDFLIMKTGHGGFTGYLIFTAEEPVEVGFGKVLDYGPMFVWILRIVELIVIFSVGLFIVQNGKKSD